MLIHPEAPVHPGGPLLQAVPALPDVLRSAEDKRPDSEGHLS